MLAVRSASDTGGTTTPGTEPLATRNNKHNQYNTYTISIHEQPSSIWQLCMYAIQIYYL